MMLLAILLPFLSFMVRGKILTGIICLILQITLIGWLPAAIWAVLSLNNARADQRNDKLIKAMRENKK
ncbi:YqaE/Pmp3 family membrane protein [Chryseobacterium culicis]|uniref:YqaE/Pmp3 family membrane protein n=2 Tax=Chryseobacterium culicis TaxID=680127 RepID=A0A2S9D1G5_CHRCI|nr:YqaE/Pmp3 family membrane protein [Chryseobacterium culicis]PRB92350.1 YqaE/Pmp3 family membrane protein [Chryseobacterium culicis]